MTTYAIKVMFTEDDWLYVTENTKHCMDLKVMTFDTFEAAVQAAKVFQIKGKEQNVKVVEYKEGDRIFSE